jgi:integrase/recombinase XerD
MQWPSTFENPRASFLEALKVRGASVATLANYGNGLNSFFGFLVKSNVHDLREVTRATVRDYQLWLKEQPYTVWTVQAKLQALKRLFEHLERTDQVLLNPSVEILLHRPKNALPRTILTKTEAKAILNAPNTQKPKGIRDRAILEVFYATGIRLEEMVGLTVFDVDVRNGFLRVTRGKFARDRVVPLSCKACDYLREYLNKVRSEWSRANREERSLWLLHRKPHCRLHRWNVQALVSQYAKAAGITRPITSHVWRHSCATHLVANGSSLAHVQRLLGHRSLKTTQLYTRVSILEIKQTHRKSHPRK